MDRTFTLHNNLNTVVKDENVLSQQFVEKIETGVLEEQSYYTYPICHLQMSHLPVANI